MKRLLSAVLLIASLGLSGMALAEEAMSPSAAPAVTAADAQMAPAEAAPAEAASAPAVSDATATAAPAPVPNKGDTAWMIVATLLVIMMSVPGLALFYGGLVRSKNMLSVLMQVFSIFALITLLWAIYG